MRLLVFGDSNSWGTPPDGSGLRLETRWPRLVSAALGAELVEDALPGRTTIHDDPQMHGVVQNGLAGLPFTLFAQRPLDLILIMLGTNDMKARFEPTPSKVAGNLLRLAQCIRENGGGPGAWDAVSIPAIGLIAPPPLGPLADDTGWERHEEWRGGRSVSLALARELSAMASPLGVPVLDAGTAIEASPLDPIHFDAENHRKLASAVTQWVQEFAA